MHTFLTVLHVIVGLFLILVILLQAGKGAAMGASLGSAGSQAMGSSGAGNFLTKLTTAAAITFMVTSLSLAVVSSNKDQDSVITEAEKITEPIPPAAKEELPKE